MEIVVGKKIEIIHTFEAFDSLVFDPTYPDQFYPESYPHAIDLATANPTSHGKSSFISNKVLFSVSFPPQTELVPNVNALEHAHVIHATVTIVVAQNAGEPGILLLVLFVHQIAVQKIVGIDDADVCINNKIKNSVHAILCFSENL